MQERRWLTRHTVFLITFVSSILFTIQWSKTKKQTIFPDNGKQQNPVLIITRINSFEWINDEMIMKRRIISILKGRYFSRF